MHAVYLGDSLEIPKNTSVELTLDDDSLRVETRERVFNFPRAELNASLENRLLFDPSTRRIRPRAFIINMTELRGEAHLRQTLRIETPTGPLWFITGEDERIVASLKRSRPFEERPARDQWKRTMLSLAVLAFVALTIALISTRLNLH